MRIRHDDAFPTRRSLLSRLKDLDDQTSWREFYDIYWKLIYNTARKAGLAEAEAEDVVQTTMLTVSRKIRDLKYDPALGSFRGWLLNTTRWRISDEFRRRLPAQAHAPDDERRRTATIDRIPDDFDMDRIWEEDWKRNLADAALRRVRRYVNPKSFQVYDLYVLKGWPVAKVSKTLGISAGSVYLAKNRITAALRKEIRYLETNLV